MQFIFLRNIAVENGFQIFGIASHVDLLKENCIKLALKYDYPF